MNRLNQVRNQLNLLFLWTKVDVEVDLKKALYGAESGLEQTHVFLRLILNQLRLPISPLRH